MEISEIVTDVATNNTRRIINVAFCHVFKI